MEAGLHVATTGTDPDRRRRHRWWLAGVASTVGAAVVLVVLLRSWGSTGDPGGRILAQLRPVAYSLPAGTRVNDRQLDEPTRDSCDGRPGTQGWSEVAVGVNIDWAGPAGQLVAAVDRHMRALGWRFTPTVDNGQPGGRWSKVLAEGTSAVALLGVEPGGSTWSLWAMAPPAGHPASGC